MSATDWMGPMRRLLAAALFVAALLPAGKPWAHEFWISPDRYQIAEGEALTGALRVGQNFSGSAFPFIADNFARFEVISPEGMARVEGRMGDVPAMKIAAPVPGLNVIVHQTKPTLLRWAEWEKFTGFCKHKDFTWAIEDHLARGLPDAGFKESYTRFGKSLVAVGAGAGADAAVGMETEIVALANPYTDDLAGGLPVLVLYQGAPRKDVQVEVFARAPDNSVTDTYYRTDMEGKATIPVVAGTEYLVDAVVMRPLPGSIAEDTPVWESLWASLTFRAPD
jgi:uncharacterized GH25 family protein